MPQANPSDGGGGRQEHYATLPMSPAEAGFGAEVKEAVDDDEPRFFESPKRIAQTIIIAIVAVAAIYFLFPQVVGVEDGLKKLTQGDPMWIAVAFVFSLLMFASYVALFRGVIGAEVRLKWQESYEITMASLAATRLFSAGGAGGIVLTYWALRKAGMPPKNTAARMVAFNVLLYAVYMLTLLINGVLLRTGVFSGPAPAGMTVVPAVIAGAVIAIFLLITLVPGDLEKRFSKGSQASLWGRTMRRLATVPATLAVGTREALSFLREPSRGGLALGGAIGFWAAQIAILAASFKAFGVDPSLSVVVQGFFVGMFANLLPLPGRGRRRRRGDDRGLRPLRPPRQQRLRRRPRLPLLRLLAAVAARYRGLLPAARHGQALGGAPGQPPGGQRHRREPSGSHYFIK